MAFGDNLRSAHWLALVCPTSAGAASYFHHPWIFVVCVVVVLPISDSLIGRARSAILPRKDSIVHDAIIPFIFLTGWLLVMALGALRVQQAGPLEFSGLILACGILSGMSMAHSHEICHRPGKIWKGITDLTFALAGYPHYRLAHELHHAHVGDPRYGSTASLGTSVWMHVPQSFSASTKACLNSLLNHEATQPRMVRAMVLLIYGMRTASLPWLFISSSGWRGALFLMSYSILSIFVTEAIGYIQHYGLQRSEGFDDNLTAWDIDFFISNLLFANNGYHSYHHQNQKESYSLLRPGNFALPGGYFHLLWLALVPRIWFAVMDPRVRFRRESAALSATVNHVRQEES